MQRIRFLGQEFILTHPVDGAIATEEQYRVGKVGFAHLFEDGVIRRYGKKIGMGEDIEFIGEMEDIRQDEGAELNLMEDIMCKVWNPFPFFLIGE